MTSATKSLAELGLTAQGGREARVTGLAVDSRQVKLGNLFAALPGSRIHGGEFIQFALRMGAAAILTDRAGAEIASAELSASDAALVVTEDPRQALAFAAALWFGRQPETVVAVTGTSGKTSVATFTRQIWQALGLHAANLGTMGVLGDFTAPLAHTTPEPITLHRLLAEMAGAGITHAAMEASSHGLDQGRLDGVHLKAGAFTNFSQDHLDYHADFEEYFAAKAGLFNRVLPEDATAVVNIDEVRGREMAKIAGTRGLDLITVGRAPLADLCIGAQRFDATGQIEDLGAEQLGQLGEQDRLFDRLVVAHVLSAPEEALPSALEGAGVLGHTGVMRRLLAVVSDARERQLHRVDAVLLGEAVRDLARATARVGDGVVDVEHHAGTAAAQPLPGDLRQARQAGHHPAAATRPTARRRSLRGRHEAEQHGEREQGKRVADGEHPSQQSEKDASKKACGFRR